MNTQITIKDLEKNYLRKMPKAKKDVIETYINEPLIQNYIKKAISSELTDNDFKQLYKIGKQKSKYSNLYWLCAIYIHPFTIAAELLIKLEKINK